MKTLPVVVSHFEKLVEIKSHKQLTPVINRLVELNKQLESTYEELQSFYAPSECYCDVVRSYKYDVESIVKEEGFINFDIFIKVLINRTSSRWVYTSNLGSLFQMCTNR